MANLSPCKFYIRNKEFTYDEFREYLLGGGLGEHLPGYKLKGYISEEKKKQNLQKREDEKIKKQDIRGVLSDEPNSPEEAILQHFLAGNRVDTDQLSEAVGYGKGSTEFKQLLWAHKKGGEGLDVLYESIPLLEMLEKRGAKDIANEVGRILRAYPTKGKILERLLEMKAEREGREFYEQDIPDDWVAPVINDIAQDLSQKIPDALTVILNDAKIDIDKINSVQELRDLVDARKEDFNDSFPFNKEEYAEAMKFIDDYEKRLDADKERFSNEVSNAVEKDGVPGKGKGKLERELDEKIAAINSKITDVTKERQRKLDSLNNKNELDLGVSKSNELDLQVSNSISGAEMEKLLSPFDNEIAELKRDAESLESQRESTVKADQAQTDLFDKTIDFLDKLKVDTKDKLLDASLGLPIAAWNTAIDIIKLGVKTGKVFTEAIQDAVDYLKKTVKGFDATKEKEFVDLYTDLFSKKEDQLRADVLSGLESKKENIETEIFGSPTKKESDFNKSTSFVNKVLASIQQLQENTIAKATDKLSDKMAKILSKALVSNMSIVRNSAKLFDSFVRNSAKTIKDIQRGEQATGEKSSRSIEDAIHIFRGLAKITGKDKGILKRLNQVIDPDFYRERSKEDFLEDERRRSGDEFVDNLTEEQSESLYQSYRDKMGFNDPNYKEITFDDLSPDEQSAIMLIRKIYDYIHDVNFAIGKIKLDTYINNKGKYSARIYDKYEMPQEAQEAWDSIEKNTMYSGIYKPKGEIYEWNIEHLIENPVHAVSKRFFQTMYNKAIYDYSKTIMTEHPEWVSKTEKDGFTKLGNGYGVLSNKFIRGDVAEDFIGIHYTNKNTQMVYDVVKAYDRSAPRKFYRKLFTVLNPGTQIGNFMTNLPMSMMLGVNPIRMQKNFWGFALSEVKNYGDTYRYLLSKGLLNSDITRGDMAEMFSNFNKEISDPKSNVLSKGNKLATHIYRVNDDLAKISAFKSLVDMGISQDIALNRVANAFQNAKRTGRVYDFASKMPVIGMMFGRWASDVARLTQHGITKRPLNVAALIATAHAIAYAFSVLSGESEEERKIREGRSTAKIPMPKLLGGDIPLTWKIGKNELNVARFMSPIYVYTSPDEDDRLTLANKILPIPLEWTDYTNNPEGKIAVTLSKFTNDPVVAPLLQGMLFNADFKGLPVSDPKETIYNKSNLTNTDRAVNVFRFMMRGYIPYGGTLDDFARAIKSKEDYYGRKKTSGQVLLRFLGWNSQQFQQDRYYKTIMDEANSISNRLDQNKKDTWELIRDLSKGEITKKQYDKKFIEYQEKNVMLMDKMNKTLEKYTPYIKKLPYQEILKLESEYLKNKK